MDHGHNETHGVDGVESNPNNLIHLLALCKLSTSPMKTSYKINPHPAIPIAKPTLG